MFKCRGANEVEIFYLPVEVVDLGRPEVPLEAICLTCCNR